MARFVFPSSSHCKVLFLFSCITALVVFQAPVALAQRGAPHFGGGGQLGSGGHFAGGARVTAPHVTTPYISVPPPRRAPTAPFRFLGGPHPTNLGASYLRFRGRPIRPRPVLPIVPFPVFVGGPFVGYWPGYGFNSLWWPSCAVSWGWRFGCNTILYAPYYGYGMGDFISPTASPNIAPPEYAPPPSYLYGAEESRQRPELYLKDGTVYRVTDSWLIDGRARQSLRGP